MKTRFDKDSKIELSKYAGLAYDATIVFNSIKEKKLGSQYRKQNTKIINIINPILENELTQQTYEIEEKLKDLRKIRDKIKRCKELYETNKLENEKIHLKVEELNAEGYRLISDIETDLLKLKQSSIGKEESYVEQETKKNARINLCLQLHEVASEIKQLNMKFLLNDAKYKEQEKNDWYNKALQDKEMADLMIDQLILDESDIEAIAKRREDDITNIINSFKKISEQFKQLQLLVIEQGTVLDRIDYNLSKAEEKTKQGKGELRKGNERSKGSDLARKVIWIQVILIIFFSFLLYIKYRSKYVRVEEHHYPDPIPQESIDQ